MDCICENCRALVWSYGWRSREWVVPSCRAAGLPDDGWQNITTRFELESRSRKTDKSIVWPLLLLDHVRRDGPNCYYYKTPTSCCCSSSSSWLFGAPVWLAYWCDHLLLADRCARSTWAKLLNPVTFRLNGAYQRWGERRKPKRSRPGQEIEPVTGGQRSWH